MVETGLSQLCADGGKLLRGRRVGLIANPTAIDAEFRHAADLLSHLPGVRLTTLFGPEHGVRGDAQDMIAVAGDVRDRRTQLPVHSLYGHTVESLRPSAAMLEDVDVLVFDIQDVGSRYYTFVWTMVLAMRAAAQHHKGFVVLDRPNPIGGIAIEGGAIASGFESFVGLVSCPNRHGFTAGEIARWRAAAEGLDLDLQVVGLRGWNRRDHYSATGLPWVMPSPNMPTVETALVYPGMCLVEGSELSEGRGTTRPFELAGAPWIDPDALAERLHGFGLPGVRFRPVTFTPTFHKFAGQACGGVQLHVTDADGFLPLLTGVAFLKACHDLSPEQFRWRQKAYEFVDEIPAIDLLCGNPHVRQGIEAGLDLRDLAQTWAEAETDFVQARVAQLLYE